MKTNKARETLRSSIRIKIFWPRNRRHSTQTLRAKPGHSFTDENVDLLLERVAGHVEKKFPAHEYSLVPLGPKAFNFVWRGERSETTLHSEGRP